MWAMKMPKITLKLIDLFGIVFVAALCSLAWKAASTLGWIAIIASLTSVFYFIRHFRMPPETAPISLLIVPLVGFCVFAIALLSGQRHPPFLAPGDFEWPRFESMEERLSHAFAISCWTLFWSPQVIIICGLLRRALPNEKSTESEGIRD
jgi:hypothetical protein